MVCAECRCGFHAQCIGQGCYCDCQVPIDIASPDEIELSTHKDARTVRLVLKLAQKVLCDIAQLLDGWHADGTVWTEWDESVRREVSLLQGAIEAELNLHSEVAIPEFLALATRIQEINEDRRLNGGLNYAQWDELVGKADAVIAKAKGK